jgi:GT2 family glycosyltransferase
VECRPGWLDQVARDVQPGALYGPSLQVKHGWGYLEGYCIAARREVWDALGGWEEDYYQGLYWEDNDLCARAVHAGYRLEQTRWPVWHYNNYTSQHIPGARENGPENERKFLERVAAWQK